MIQKIKPLQNVYNSFILDTVFANKFPQLIFDFFGLLIARIKGICSE